VTGPAVAAVIGGVLAEWRRTGYLPTDVCAQLHPFDAAVRCHRPRGHGGCHTDDGQDPWTEEAEDG
jgi:hypothetical protein